MRKSKLILIVFVLLFSIAAKAFAPALPLLLPTIFSELTAAGAALSVFASGASTAALSSIAPAVVGAGVGGLALTVSENGESIKAAVGTLSQAASPQPENIQYPLSNTILGANGLYMQTAWGLVYGTDPYELAVQYAALNNAAGRSYLSPCTAVRSDGVVLPGWYGASLGVGCQASTIAPGNASSATAPCASGRVKYGSACVISPTSKAATSAVAALAADKTCSMSYDSSGCFSMNPADPDCGKIAPRVAISCSAIGSKVTIYDPATGTSLIYDRPISGTSTVTSSRPTTAGNVETTTATLNPGATANDIPTVVGVSTTSGAGTVGNVSSGAATAGTGVGAGTSTGAGTGTGTETGTGSQTQQIDMTIPAGIDGSLPIYDAPATYTPTFLNPIKDKLFFNFSFGSHSAECPPLNLDFNLMGRNVHVDNNTLCNSLEQYRTLIQAVMTFVYGLYAIKGILKA